MTEASLARRFGWAFTDTILITKRNLLHYVRLPQLLVYTVVQPIMFTLLFAFVFGGAIDPSQGTYIDFLIPGIVIQTVIFGAMSTGIKIAEDVQKGVMDRFRSLPIARGTVLAARTLCDTVWNTLAIFIMVAVGYAIGYRFDGAWYGALFGVAMSVLVAYSFSWLALTIGLYTRQAQAAEIAGFTFIFPFVFLSSIFVEIETMPAGLEAFAKYSPVTLSADAVRAWSYGNPVGNEWWMAIAWCIGMVAIFAPLSVWRFRRLA